LGCHLCALAQVEASALLYVVVIVVSAYLAAGARHEHRERFHRCYQQASFRLILELTSCCEKRSLGAGVPGG
jgi:hypothetical protein